MITLLGDQRMTKKIEKLTKEKLAKEIKYVFVRDLAIKYGICKQTLIKRMKEWGIQNPSNAERYANKVLNKRYGRLIVKEFAGIDKFGKTLVRCLCDCGKITIINKSSLSRSLTRSCGCYKAEKVRVKHVGDLSPAYFRRCKKSALERHHTFSINMKDVWSIYLKQNGKCAISGVPVKFVADNNNAGFQTASIDRIDSKKGYVKGNIQIVHKTINVIKWTLTMEEFEYWITMVYKHKKLHKKDFSDFKPRDKYINQI